MARDLTAGFITEISAQQLQAALLAAFEFDSGTTRVWSGYGNVTWDGNTYTGVGDLGSVENITESEEIKANGTSVTLTGVPSAAVSLALLEDYQGRPAHIWFAVMDTAGVIIDDPYEVFSGRMDVMELVDDGDNATLGISLESDLIDLQKSRERRYTPEDQKIEYPDDLGLDFVAFIQDAEITWGSS